MTPNIAAVAEGLPKGWLPHDDGPCPVESTARVKLLFAGETIATAEGTEFDIAGAYRPSAWLGTCPPRIIAYKLETRP